MHFGLDFYNDNDPGSLQWLRGLEHAGLVPPAVIDGRSIAELGRDDLVGFRRVHLFAGIAGWEHALQLAGVPRNFQCWTGSCPCQPFSTAGRGRGTADERHLWPEMLRLIALCRPPVVFGEQVASPLGRRWLAGVRADLEELGYGVGAADLCAASVGAPHIRQRLFWVAYAAEAGRERWRGSSGEALPSRLPAEPGRHGEALGLAHAPPGGLQGTAGVPEEAGRTGAQLDREEGRLAHPEGAAARAGVGVREREPDAGGGGGVGEPLGLQGRVPAAAGRGREPEAGGAGDARRVGDPGGESRRNSGKVPGAQEARPGGGEEAGGEPHEPWASSEWIACRDGKWRRTQPGVHPLAHGVPGRVAKLRGLGNAIVPQVAAIFVRAALGI